MFKPITIFAFLLLGVGQMAADDPSYNYQRQGEWIFNFPKCSWFYQSPINIETCFTIPQKSKIPLAWYNYNNNHPNMTLSYSEHAVSISADWTDLPYIAYGVLKDVYKLGNIHYHAALKDYDGSEHAINSQKLAFEFHFVHYKCSYSSLADALASNDSEALAVVAKLYKISNEPNLALTPILNAIQMEQTVTYQNLNLASLLGHETQNYFSYLGSLTSPECNEVVRWIVLEKVHTISHTQLQIVRQVKYDGVPIIPNVRLLQALNERPVYYYQP